MTAPHTWQCLQEPAAWNHGDYVNSLTKGHVWLLLLLPLKCVGKERGAFRMYRVHFWYESKDLVKPAAALKKTKGEREKYLIDVGSPPLACGAFWSVDEVQVASIFDTKEEKWGRIRCADGLLLHCTHIWSGMLTHTDPFPSKIHTAEQPQMHYS